MEVKKICPPSGGIGNLQGGSGNPQGGGGSASGKRVLSFGFSAHNLALMGHSLSILWPGRSFIPCMNAPDLAQHLEHYMAAYMEGTGGPDMALLVNLSREFHELDSALRMARARSVPVLGAVAVDFINAYSLRLCMEQELPAVIGDLDGGVELGEARDAIRDGRRFVSRSLLRGGGYRYVDFPTGFSLLSEREALCVDARLGGLSSKEASALLGLDPSTVNTYTSRAYVKLGVSSGEELVWLFAGRPMGCYRGAGSGCRPKLFPVRGRVLREDKKNRSKQ